MELKNFFAQDLQGNVIPSPTVYLYQPGTTTLAAGLKDKDGNALSNPFNGTANGQVTVAAPDGDYDMRVTGASRDTTIRVRFIDSVAGSADTLRQDLASTTTGKGAALVGAVGGSGGTAFSTVLGFIQRIMSSVGSALVGFIQSGTGAVKRTVEDRQREIISVKDFGAVGDNTHRPLSGVTSYNGVNTIGWTIAQWQTVFPHVTSLTNTLDWAGIQAAINFASTTYKRAAVFVPAGYYVITDPIQLPNFLTIYGDADHGTIINNQNVIYTGSQAVNQDPGAFLFVTMKHIVWRGGRTGLDVDVTGECAGCRFENVTWELQTDFNVNINKLLQTTSFINCNFASADYGLFVGAWTSNANNFINCSFTSHAWSHVYMRSSEVNNFYGCRFEAGGVQGRTTIDVTDTRNMNFLGCYFEATHENLIAETGSCNSILFDGCHFTGATRQGQSGWFPYQFVSDGIIQFGNNNWGVINSNGPTRMFASGVNSSVLPGNAGGTIKQLGNTGTQTVYFAHSKHHKHIVSPWVAPTSASWQKDLVVFRKENTDGAVPNMRLLTGKLTVSYYGLTGGGFGQHFAREYLVSVRSAGFSNMGATIVLGMNDTGGGATLTVQQKAGASSTTCVIEAVFSGLDYGIGGMLQWSFEYITSSKTEADYIEASLA